MLPWQSDRKLRPSEPSAIFFTGSYPANFTNFSSCAGVHRKQSALRAVPICPRLFPLLGLARSETRKFGGLTQLSDALATIPTCPSRDELKDFLDRVLRFGGPLCDTGNQELVDGC